MKQTCIELIFALLLLVLLQRTTAQSGYNYVRPDLATGSVGALAAAAATTAAGTPGGIRGGTLLPVSGFGATGTGGGGGTASGFAAQPNAFTGNQQATTAFGAPVAAAGIGAATRQRGGAQNLAQRGGGGIAAFPQYTPGATRLTGGGGGGTTGTGTGIDNDYNDGDFSAIPGVPGVDYPVYAQVPRTNFDCAQQPLPGYYADIEAQCQVFHICALNRTYSFLCPNGTVFSQETLVCVWWNQYDCVSAPSLYANNAYIYDYEQRGDRATAAGGTTGTNAYGAAGAGRLGSQLATNTVRTPTNTAAAAAGIYGSGAATGGLRGTVPNTGFIGSNAPRPYATPTPTAQYGAAVLRSGAANPTAAGNVGALSNVAVNAQSLAASTNREYLPPAAAATAGRRQ